MKSPFLDTGYNKPISSRKETEVEKRKKSLTKRNVSTEAQFFSMKGGTP